MEDNEMKKYNLSEIMKKAWEIRKTNKKSFSESLKISWKIAKCSMAETVTFEFLDGEEMTIDMETGVVSGKTYNSRNRIKKDFSGKWNGKIWTVDVDKVIDNMKKFAVTYAELYIVDVKKSVKTAVKKWLVPDETSESYWAYTKWSDGTVTSCIFG